MNNHHEPIRCGTLLCGNLAVWRRPVIFHGKVERWERKCQRCFDNGYNNPELWSKVLQPNNKEP